MAVRFVVIEIDRPRRLRFDRNAISDLEGALNMGLSSIFQEQMMGVLVLRAMLWAELRWEDRGLGGSIPDLDRARRHH